jgi:hypothetical protein
MGETGILLSILGLLAAGGIAYAASSSSTPAATTPTTGGMCTTGPLPAGYTWQDASQIVHGDHVRISMTPSTFNTVATSLGIAGGGIAGWTNMLAQPQVAAVLGSGNVCAWAPGDALPLDWPDDDTGASTEYHAEFVYAGQVAIASSNLPLPVSVWRAAPPATVTANNPGQNVGGPTIGTGATSLPGSSGGPIIQGTSSYNPSTSPQVVHLTATSAGVGTQPGVAGGTVSVGDTLTGTPITITLDDPAGGTASFQSVSYINYVTDASGNVTGQQPPIPMQTATLGSVLPFVTSAVAGEVDIIWQDSTGATHTAVVKFD